MNATLLYRIAAVLLLVLALGHTIAFLKLKPPTAEGLAVRDAMNKVHFQVGGKDHSYGGLYIGFGLSISIYLLFSAWLVWHLGSLAARTPQAIGTVGWAFCLVMVANSVLAWAYFTSAAFAFSVVLAVCLGWAAWLVSAAK